jgi:hypothetical protein
MKFTILQILIALDQLVNAILGGWADETLSSHSYRLDQAGKPWGFLRKGIDLLFFFDKDHCKGAYESERMRSHSPPAQR